MSGRQAALPTCTLLPAQLLMSVTTRPAPRLTLMAILALSMLPVILAQMKQAPAVGFRSISPGPTLNTSTGLISGTISASGTFNWVSRVTDDVAATDDQALSATIQDITITIITPALSDAPLNEPYPSLQTEALGGELPLTWTISEGSLPTGLSLSAGGLISGIATTLGSSTFKILVTDSSTPTALTDEREYTMEVVETKGTCCIPPSP